jgi:hypothetical protein
MNSFRAGLLLLATILFVVTFAIVPDHAVSIHDGDKPGRLFCFNPVELVPEFSRNPDISEHFGLQLMQKGPPTSFNDCWAKIGCKLANLRPRNDATPSARKKPQISSRLSLWQKWSGPGLNW